MKVVIERRDSFMNDYPNIFDYSTKELTQDAMICWFLECLSSADNRIKEIGKEFLRTFVFNNTISIEEAELIECSKQYHKMDVYARVLINKREIYPIIFENKTNTFLHNDQLERYCGMVYKWFWDKPEKALEDQKKDICNHQIIVDSTINFSEMKICNTQYVLFKSSYIFKWEKEEFENQKMDYYKKNGKTDFHLCKLEDMKILLDKISVDKNEISLIDDYRNYIEKKIKSEETDADWDNWKNKKDDFEKALNSHLGQWKFFEACGAEDINCQSNSGLWSSYSIVK